MNPQIPPLPSGWLFYGKGPLLHKAKNQDRYFVTSTHLLNKWDFTGWTGTDSEYYYAVKAGTEMARLNGLEPMSTRPSGMPDDLLDPPEPPAGHRWVYRGLEWQAKDVQYAFAKPYCKWAVSISNPIASGMPYHYLEAVVIEPPTAVWTFASKDWEPPHEPKVLRKQIEDLNDLIDEQHATIRRLSLQLGNIRDLLER